MAFIDWHKSIWIYILNKCKSGITSSFAYYIFPLIAITLAFIFLKEIFSNFQTIAIFLAIIAIILLSLGIETFPFISVIMGGTFAIYGLIKKN